MIDDPDARLVARIARGDVAAIEAFVIAKLPRVLALAERMLGDRGDAEDVAQETFVRVWRHAARWQPGAARFDTWMHRVTLNLCRDRLRRRREVVMAEPPERADPAPLQDGVLEADQTAARVAAALAALPDRQREAIILTYYQELSNAESAATMEIGVEALESLLARARRGLRRILPEMDDD